MFGSAGRARRRIGKSAPARYRELRSEWLEPRAMMTTVNAAPTIAHPITGASAPVSGKTVSLSVLGNDDGGASKLTYNWTITGSPAGGGATFSSNGSNAAQNTTLTFSKAGAYTVSVKIVDTGGLSTSTSMTVNVSAVLTSIKLATPSNSVLNTSSPFNVAATNQVLVAQGLDQFGNAMATQPTFHWANSTVPSGASAPTLSGSGSTETFTFGKIGAYGESVTATSSNTSITSRVTLQVVPVPSYITVTQVGGNAQITSTSAQFTVSGFQDQFHNAIAGATTVAWTTTVKPSTATAPTFTINGATTTVSFKAAGQYTLTATEHDNSGHSVAQSITVTVAQQATSVASHSSAAVNVTTTSTRLTVPAILDQFGTALAVQPQLVWSTATLPAGATAPSFATSGGVTTVTFAMAGSYTLTAKVATATNIAFNTSVVVTPTLTSIVVTPGAATVTAAATQQYVAQARDQFGKAMTSQPVYTWTTTGGSITGNGLLTAPASAGSLTITAKSGSISGTTTATISAASNFLGLQNTALATLLKNLDNDGSISRNDMLQIFTNQEGLGTVSATELSDLKKIFSSATTLNMPSYVQVLANDVINGNVANATYLGQTLGNLVVGSSAVQLTDLVNKWFLGTDLPTLTDSSLVYKTASGSLFPHTPSHLDEFQGELGDCYFISSIGTIADQNPAAIQNMIIDNGDGTYTVRFYTGTYGAFYTSGGVSDGFSNGVGTADYVTVNRSLATTASGMLYYADFQANYANANNALWIPLLEKAYAQWNQTGKEGRNGTDTFSGIEGGWMATVDAQVLGHNATDYTMSSANQQVMINALANHLSVTIGTNSADMYGLYGSHAYAVVGYNSASGTFTLYNPWGFSQPGQLTWAQLTASCSGFVTTSAAGSTPISGAPIKAGTIKADAPAAGDAAAADFAAGQASVAANDQYFTGTGNSSGTARGADQVAQWFAPIGNTGDNFAIDFVDDATAATANSVGAAFDSAFMSGDALLALFFSAA